MRVTTPRPPIILVDQDDTIVDLEEAFWEEWHRRFPNLPQREDVPASSWRFSDRFEADYRRQCEEILDLPGLYRSLPPIPGAREALEEMLTLGWDVRIVTAPHLSNPTCCDDKLASTRALFGAHWVARTIITRDKTLVLGDVLVDNKPNVTGLVTPTWTQVLYAYPYNHRTDLPRLTWDNWQSVLIPLTERTAA